MQNPYSIKIASLLSLSTKRVENTLSLLQDNATIPFISRYRKEITGGLDEVQIGKIREEHERLVEFDKRKKTILESIQKQGKLTSKLKAQIEETEILSDLEDLYLPYKQKRKTKGTVAKEKGLEALAKIIFEQDDIDIKKKAKEYIDEEKEVYIVEEALQGARDIIAEWVNEDKKARDDIRLLYEREAIIRSRVVKSKQEKAIKFKDYFKSEELLRDCPSHRLLAMRRGENEKFLRISIEPPEEKALKILSKIFLKADNDCAKQVEAAIEDSYKRLLGASIENEFAKLSKEKADDEAINVFILNIKQLLLAAPLGQKRIIAVDPGFRTGCKVVCLDEQGNLLEHTVIYPETSSQSKKIEAKEVLKKLAKKYKVEAIALGNGTASRETEAFLRDIDFESKIDVFVISEDGASIYSASKVAREEFPNKDVTVRGAISIGRRLMDPLAELVKIDPKSIGVGQYQHDVDQSKLKKSLGQTVENCVNLVGVNLNTASKHILTYISGLGSSLAQNIVDYRKENGVFKTRQELKKVKRLGKKAFEQCAGFLRIQQSKNPLDNTAVHPESYHIVEEMAKDLNASVSDLISDGNVRKRINIENYVTEKIGLPTLKDILEELDKPGRDPRGEVEVFNFAEDMNDIKDLEEGMVLPGIVTNVTNFGAFVDIGVHCDGLVHISQMADKFVKHPSDIVSLREKVQVKVTEIDLERKRIGLSMKGS